MRDPDDGRRGARGERYLYEVRPRDNLPRPGSCTAAGDKHMGGGDKHKKDKDKHRHKDKHKDKHRDKHKAKHHKHNKEKSHKRSRGEPEPSDSKRHRSSEPAEAAEAVLRRLIDASPKGAEDVRTLLSMLDSGEALLQSFRTAWALQASRTATTGPEPPCHTSGAEPGGLGRGCRPMTRWYRAAVKCLGRG